MIEERLSELTQAINLLTASLNNAVISGAMFSPVTTEVKPAKPEKSKPIVIDAVPEPEHVAVEPAKEPDAPAPENVPEPVAVAAEPPAEPVKETDTAETVTLDELKELMRQAFSTVGGDKVKEIIASFGKTRLSDIAESDFPALKAKLSGEANG